MRSRAQVVAWVAVMLPLVFLPIVGMSMDAGLVFDARRELQNVADGAARVGAMEIDRTRLRDDGVVRLDPQQARDAARDYVQRAAPEGSEAVINTTAQSVTVSVRQRVRPSFLRLLKVQAVPIEATGQARPCAGIETSACVAAP